jgi:phosphoenolpyruvate carboxykinase (GTP)
MPKIFHVNWFRTDERGRFIWPGFGENIRVLRWIAGRLRGDAPARETPIGYVPAPGGIDLRGIEHDVTPSTLDALLTIDPESWREELADQAAFFAKFGERMPDEIWRQHAALAQRLGVNGAGASTGAGTGTLPGADASAGSGTGAGTGAGAGAGTKARTGAGGAAK